MINTELKISKKVSESIEQYDVDVIIGSRLLDDTKEKIPTYRKLNIKITTKIINSTLKKKIIGLQIGFRSHCKNAKI